MINIYPYGGVFPEIHPTAFIAPNAVIIGDVKIGAYSSIWYNTTLRGDVNEIRVGENTNIQDGCIVHVAAKGQGCYIGDRVSIGHMALVHACNIHDDSFIGMKSCVMDDAVVMKGAIIGAGALVSPRKQVGIHELWTGVPAKKQREVNPQEQVMIDWTWPQYAKLAQEHKKNMEAN